MRVFLTANRGWGVQAAEVIPRGSFIVEYAGTCSRDLSKAFNDLRTKIVDAAVHFIHQCHLPCASLVRKIKAVLHMNV